MKRDGLSIMAILPTRATLIVSAIADRGQQVFSSLNNSFDRLLLALGRCALLVFSFAVEKAQPISRCSSVGRAVDL